MRFGSDRYSSPIEGSVGGSTDGGFESSTNPLLLLVDLTPGPDPQTRSRDVPAGMPRARMEAIYVRAVGGVGVRSVGFFSGSVFGGHWLLNSF